MNDCDATPEELCAVIVYVFVIHAVVGVPEMTPVDVLKFNPLNGKIPASIEKLAIAPPVDTGVGLVNNCPAVAVITVGVNENAGTASALNVVTVTLRDSSEFEYLTPFAMA